MATPFSDIINYASLVFKDYKLNELYNISATDYLNAMSGYVVRGATKYKKSKRNWDLITDETNQQFTEDLTLTEKIILSDLTVIEWMSSQILDVTQFKLKLNDTDFKHYAESQNLSGKMNAQELLRERVTQEISDYNLKNIDFTKWANGDFS